MDQIIFDITKGLGWIVAPALLIWGWMRWVGQPNRWTITSILSLGGFLLATTSALLAVSTMMYARVIGGFTFYDPLLMRIYRIGMLLSLSGIVLGVCGVWRPNSLRWHSPASAAGMFAFWAWAAGTE
jgi:hypothetical protein